MSVRRIPAEINGIPVLVEAVAVGDEYTSAKPLQDRVEDLFGKAQRVIEATIVSTSQMVRATAFRAAHPDQVEIQFGLKFSTQAGVIFTSVASEASLAVKVIFGPFVAVDEEDSSNAEDRDGQR
ncbi:CU044_2847 family protein [Micromonospora sp. CA-240977]|uniref:CU044_2847 family protein n=1 Tax=Micromonospora sp. CA-240977 TaxID=3239957 RepID=UPI003D8C9956